MSVHEFGQRCLSQALLCFCRCAILQCLVSVGSKSTLASREGLLVAPVGFMPWVGSSTGRVGGPCLNLQLLGHSPQLTLSESIWSHRTHAHTHARQCCCQGDEPRRVPTPSLGEVVRLVGSVPRGVCRPPCSSAPCLFPFHSVSPRLPASFTWQLKTRLLPRASQERGSTAWALRFSLVSLEAARASDLGQPNSRLTHFAVTASFHCGSA